MKKSIMIAAADQRKIMSQSSQSTPIIRTLDFARKWVAAVPWTDLETTCRTLRGIILRKRVAALPGRYTPLWHDPATVRWRNWIMLRGDGAGGGNRTRTPLGTGF